MSVKGKGKRKQITGTFRITAAGRFLCIELIYAWKTQRCHSKGIPFRDEFDVNSIIIIYLNLTIKEMYK